MDYSELSIDLTLITGEVVTHRHEEGNQYHYFTFPEGEIYMDESGRLEFGACRPKNCTCNDRPQYPNTITVNRSKPLSTIAQDITRRLLPHAREYWQACQEAQTKHDRRVEAMEKTVQCLSPWLTLLTWQYQPGYSAKLITPGTGKVEADLYTNGNVHELKIRNPTLEQTFAILEIMNP